MSFCSYLEVKFDDTESFSFILYNNLMLSLFSQIRENMKMIYKVETGSSRTTENCSI